MTSQCTYTEPYCTLSAETFPQVCPSPRRARREGAVIDRVYAELNVEVEAGGRDAEDLIEEGLPLEGVVLRDAAAEDPDGRPSSSGFRSSGACIAPISKTSSFSVDLELELFAEEFFIFTMFRKIDPSWTAPTKMGDAVPVGGREERRALSRRAPLRSFGDVLSETSSGARRSSSSSGISGFRENRAEEAVRLEEGLLPEAEVVDPDDAGEGRYWRSPALGSIFAGSRAR